MLSLSKIYVTITWLGILPGIMGGRLTLNWCAWKKEREGHTSVMKKDAENTEEEVNVANGLLS